MKPLRSRVACDDTEFRYFGSSRVCDACRHRIGFGRLACAAFPDRIPKEIWNSQHDHQTPYPGDQGIRFEPMTAEDQERRRQIEEERHAWYLRLREKLIAEGKLSPKTATEEPASTNTSPERATG